MAPDAIFCNQMRPAMLDPRNQPQPTWNDDDNPSFDDEWGAPCCRMRYHHVLNNPFGGTRIPLDLHLCEACVGDYVRLQVNGNYEPGYFTEHEENEEEEDFTDDPPVDLAIN